MGFWFCNSIFNFKILWRHRCQQTLPVLTDCLIYIRHPVMSLMQLKWPNLRIKMGWLKFRGLLWYSYKFDCYSWNMTKTIVWNTRNYQDKHNNHRSFTSDCMIQIYKAHELQISNFLWWLSFGNRLDKLISIYQILRKDQSALLWQSQNMLLKTWHFMKNLNKGCLTGLVFNEERQKLYCHFHRGKGSILHKCKICIPSLIYWK